MVRFFIGQRWVTKDSKLRGKVVEISDEGRSGVVVVTDEKGNLVDRYAGAAAGFQGSGHWQAAT